MALRRRRTALVMGAVLATLSLLPGAVPAAHAVSPPAGYPIIGLDVSTFQGTVDWGSVAARGALFAYARASEQANIPDGSFAANYAAAKGTGLFVGAYHRARPDVSSGRAQADYFLDQAQYARDGRTLPPMIDIEWPRSTWTGLNACYNLSPAALVAWIRDFVDEVTARTGQLAMIYTNPNWWNPCTGGDASFGAYPLFNSGYTPTPPPTPSGWARWTFWQYGNEGVFPGDQDVFDGDYAALQRLAGGIPAPVSLRANVNGRYVTAENGGTAPLIANRSAVGGWEQFYLVDAGGGYVALRSNVNGRFVTADNAGNAPLIANRSVVDAWEKFQLITNGDGSVSLRANVNGRYVTAENAGASALIANRTAIDLWEKFTLSGPSVVVSLRADVNSRYVTAENGGSLPLIANRTAVATWEQFDVVDAGGGYVALRSRANGRYVTAENGGASSLIANRTAVAGWEKFQLVASSGGAFALRANANGMYVTAENGGASPLIANRSAVALWEQFHLTSA